MEVKFNEETHTYTRGEQKLISVTQLLEKHEIAPSYAGVNFDLLKQKAEFGTLIHSEIEKFIKTGDKGFTEEVENFAKLVEENGIEIIDCEQVVSNDLVAGKYDIKCRIGGKLYYLDNKTTSVLHKNTIEWQTTLYGTLDNPQEEFGVGAIHIHDGECKLVLLERINENAVNHLLECEQAGIKYQSGELISIADQEIMLSAERQIVELEKQIKVYEEQKKNVQKQLLEAIKQSGLKTVELCGGELRITYTEPTTRETFDSKKFKTDYPKLYEEYIKVGNVKDKLTITLRNKEE